MKKATKIYLAFLTLICPLTFLFRNTLFPKKSYFIEIKTLHCTCPDAALTKGQNYLKNITPDSLLKYDFDYSEVYFEDVPDPLMTPFLRGKFKITVEIIGKDRVGINSRWHPLVRVKSWD
jgi:hypothetical protein